LIAPLHGVLPRFEACVRRPAFLPRIRPVLAEHFELFLTTIGVVMAILIVPMELSRGEQGLATATLVWVQGFLIWAVHRHCWFRRRALVRKMRVMLQDKVNNQLTVMLGAAELHGRAAAAAAGQGQAEIERAVLAARTVSEELDHLSLESVSEWERRYRRGLPASLA
jgi:hypothetical protein